VTNARRMFLDIWVLGYFYFMPQREFEITIAPDGSVELHIKGYKGKSCLEAMKMFEQVVGELKARRETNEFYEPDEGVQFNIEQRH
jgi:hypothetical protein